MRWAAKLLATVGGLGYAPIAPGTVGSLAGWAVGWWTAPAWTATGPYPIALLLWMAGGFLIGTLAADRLERDLRQHDPSVVVVDEFCSMWLILAVHPTTGTFWGAFAAFLIFRAFDIVKPWPLQWMARARGGLGIMLDDVGAAVYTILVLEVARRLLAAILG